MGPSIFFILMIASTSALLASSLIVVFDRKRDRRIQKSTTKVSIVKPIRGLEPKLEINLESFFKLSDRVPYELLLCIKDPNDPAVPVVRRLIERYPEVDAKLYLASSDLGKNPKISNMHQAWDEANSDIILISDSNVRVGPHYLEDLITERRKGAGLVTQCVYGADAKGIGGHLDVTHLNSFYLKATVFLEIFNICCVLGKCMLLSRRSLERLGGLFGVRQYLAEDLVIGERMKDEGYTISRVPQLLRQTTVMDGLSAYWKRHVRWARLRKCHVFLAYLAEPLLFESFWPLIVLAVIARDSWMTPWVWFCLVAQYVSNLCLYGFVFKEANVWKSFVFIPLKDLMAPAIWVAGLVSNVVVWRGQKLHLRFGGKLGSRYSRSARLRVWGL